MRLSKIKLAGFKSFVDPTTITFPSSLVGVVGPNGCGKSNVIDAVRWVMGESSASRLRGDSITDVIFNGSSSRKPIGAASVELLFDNTDTNIGPLPAGDGTMAGVTVGVSAGMRRGGVGDHGIDINVAGFRIIRILDASGKDTFETGAAADLVIFVVDPEA